MKKRYKCLNRDCGLDDVYDIIPPDERPYRPGVPLRCKRCGCYDLLPVN